MRKFFITSIVTLTIGHLASANIYCVEKSSNPRFSINFLLKNDQFGRPEVTQATVFKTGVPIMSLPCFANPQPNETYTSHYEKCAALTKSGSFDPRSPYIDLMRSEMAGVVAYFIPSSQGKEQIILNCDYR